MRIKEIHSRQIDLSSLLPLPSPRKQGEFYVPTPRRPSYFPHRLQSPWPVGQDKVRRSGIPNSCSCKCAGYRGRRDPPVPLVAKVLGAPVGSLLGVVASDVSKSAV